MAALIALLAGTLSPAPAGAQASNTALQLFEEKIKAGLVYNFLKYTTWPADSFTATQKNLRVCLFGDDSFNGYLDPLSGRHAQQFMIEVVEIDRVADVKGCSLVFISASEKGSADDILESIRNSHVMTVSDIPGFARKGGMVEFAKEDQRVVFYINRRAVQMSDLAVQDRILKLAKPVSE